MALPPVAVIVLNWNARDDTLACLHSLAQLDYPAVHVVVVDNGSADNSVPAIRERHPEVTLLVNRENVGFTGGVNLAIQHLGAEFAYALLLNNDAEVAPGALRQLVDAAEADPRVAVAGPTIYYFDRRDIIWSAGGAVDWTRGALRMLGIDEIERGQFGEAPRAVDFVSGCALLIRVAALARAGRLDDRFFAYCEEAEWCVRIARAGFGVLHVPAAHAWHKISPAARAASPLVHYYMTRNRLLFLRLTGAGWRAWAHTLFLDYARTLLSWSVRPKWRHQRRMRNAMVRALLDYAGGRFGRAPLAIA